MSNYIFLKLCLKKKIPSCFSYLLSGLKYFNSFIFYLSRQISYKSFKSFNFSSCSAMKGLSSNLLQVHNLPFLSVINHANMILGNLCMNLLLNLLKFMITVLAIDLITQTVRLPTHADSRVNRTLLFLSLFPSLFT